MCWDACVAGVEQELANERELKRMKRRTTNTLQEIFKVTTGTGPVSYVEDDPLAEEVTCINKTFPGNRQPIVSSDITDSANLILEYLGDQGIKDMPMYAPRDWKQ